MTAQRIRVASGVIDVHAHWLPEELYGLPPGSPLPPMARGTGGSTSATCRSRSRPAR